MLSLCTRTVFGQRSSRLDRNRVFFFFFQIRFARRFAGLGSHPIMPSPSCHYDLDRTGQFYGERGVLNLQFSRSMLSCCHSATVVLCSTCTITVNTSFPVRSGSGSKFLRVMCFSIKSILMTSDNLKPPSRQVASCLSLTIFGAIFKAITLILFQSKKGNPIRPLLKRFLTRAYQEFISDKRPWYGATGPGQCTFRFGPVFHVIYILDSSCDKDTDYCIVLG